MADLTKALTDQRPPSEERIQALMVRLGEALESEMEEGGDLLIDEIVSTLWHLFAQSAIYAAQLEGANSKGILAEMEKMMIALYKIEQGKPTSRIIIPGGTIQ